MEHNKAELKHFSGLDVPVEPKLDWYWLSDTNAGCEINKGGNIDDCAHTYCHKCIYSRYNAGKRKDFYKEFINSTPAIGQKELLDKAWAVFNGVAHFGIDWLTSKQTHKCFERQDYHNGFVIVGADQLVHTTCLLGTALLCNW